MSIYLILTKQDFFNFSKLAQQQKNQQTEKIKHRILKQTHDIKLAKNFSSITESLGEVN